RILEVYLFFIVSVLGCTGLGKAPFQYSSKSKDKNSNQKLEQRLPLQQRAGLIIPPEFLNIGQWHVTEGRSHVDSQKESSGDDDGVADLKVSKAGSFSGTSNPPLLTAIEFYHHILIHSTNTSHNPDAKSPDIAPRQVLSPLLI
ncbi:MAG: hypothetical protein HGB11_08865, partial [Chlorobiales bacterium]|nr:hypothetical protein [Chlorobiales bacterium]